MLEQPNIVFLSLLKPNENTSTLVNISMISVVWFLDVNSHPVVALNVPVWLVLANISAAASMFCFHTAKRYMPLASLRLAVVAIVDTEVTSTCRVLMYGFLGGPDLVACCRGPPGMRWPLLFCRHHQQGPQCINSPGKVSVFLWERELYTQISDKKGKRRERSGGCFCVCVSCMYDRTLVQHVCVHYMHPVSIMCH